ncbi:hypothetical protein FRAAL4946 [Frankia alni ACN14a]|uniref:Uncharacterized protein n=1 Tax=Frankia alni (strain DSM 45986 / CECT 9034 / ACN14a) TaxID=326424 RepID=Q0RG02_FRAAA|nr:hypothetical protein FRAAL4946 [Frankia alni ACN14a]
MRPERPSSGTATDDPRGHVAQAITLSSYLMTYSNDSVSRGPTPRTARPPRRPDSSRQARDPAPPSSPVV